MRHDIYSVGVCLLEIGLWQSFVEGGSEYDSIALGKVLGYGDTSGVELFKDPSQVKEKLVRAASGKLRR